MSFNLKPFGSTPQHSSNAPQVDWNAINEQVETDNHTAVISQIVDLGIHTPPLSANIEKSTEFDTREEVEVLQQAWNNVKERHKGTLQRMSDK